MITNKMVKTEGVSYALHCSKESKQKMTQTITKLQQKLKRSYKRMDIKDNIYNYGDDFVAADFNKYFVIPSQVNYVTETVFVPGYTHPDAPKLQVLSQLLSSGPLHKLIREKGGAYGSGARLNSLAGAITFTTYRDPNTQKSFDNFRLAVEEISLGKFEYDLKSKFQLVGSRWSKAEDVFRYRQSYCTLEQRLRLLQSRHYG